MSVLVTLSYRRTPDDLSTGSIKSNENGLVTEEGEFADLEFKRMLQQLAAVLLCFPEDQTIDVQLQRTDREGLLAYKLDAKTVELLRTDTVAAIQAMEYPTHSPSGTVRRVREERTAPLRLTPIRAGHEALIDSFGDVLYFKLRGHELECPGCGFWGMFTSPGLLADPERAGQVFKTIFVCPKKCKERFAVTCQETLGYVATRYLLEHTKLDRFYFPRAWNGGRSWISREGLQKKYDEYKKEKESTSCSQTMVE
jgi:hypothetical protein